MKVFYLALAALSVISCSPRGQWNQKEYDRILASIKAPEFKADTIDIVQRGAVAEDANFRNDSIINGAIAELSANGGGVVKVPAGVYHTAGIVLKDNVNLHLCEGSVLSFSTRYEDYLPVVWTRWEGYDCYNYRPLIYGNEVRNVAVTGKGVIDGNASAEIWWWMKGRKDLGFVDGMPSQITHGRKVLFQQVMDGVDYHERIMGDGAYLRPQLFNIMKGENILLEGVTFKNSPFWVIHPVLCRNVIVKDVTVDSHGANNDGCDPESCKGVLIEGCHFITGDDCIALKSGRNEDGRAWGVPCEDVIIRNCLMEDGHGAITIGSEISGGARNIYAENCTVDSPEMYNAVRIKSNTCRGGVIEDIHVRNIEVLKCKKAAIIIDLVYEPNENSTRGFYPFVRNVSVDKLNLKSCHTFVKIAGIEEKPCIDNIHVSDCRVSGIQKLEDISGIVNNYVTENIDSDGIQ